VFLCTLTVNQAAFVVS